MSPDMPVNALDLWRDEVRSGELERLGQTYGELKSWVSAQRALERDHLNLMVIPDGGADHHNAFTPVEVAGFPAARPMPPKSSRSMSVRMEKAGRFSAGRACVS